MLPILNKPKPAPKQEESKKDTKEKVDDGKQQPSEKPNGEPVDMEVD